ncbi:MAG: ribokinase, partial [Deltaproteobacteria bacterium]|nr:ribokinase [Deltaproteobacteria bacterium]
VDAQRERTIIVIGERMNPRADDALPWEELAQYDAVYLTGADRAGIRAARMARKLVATSRIVPVLREAAVELDVLIGSASDPGEHYDGSLVPAPRTIVRTDGERGGSYQIGDDVHQYAAVPTKVSGDTYGAGDTFAAALTYALAEGKLIGEALDDAARRAVAVLAHTGPYS